MRYIVAYQSEKTASPGFQLREEFWLTCENWVIPKADLRDSCGVFELNSVYHTPCSSRQAHKSGDAAWRSPAGQLQMPPPRCSALKKWHGVCYGPKKIPMDSLVETWVWYKFTEAIRKTVFRTLPWNFSPKGPSSHLKGPLALAHRWQEENSQSWDFSSRHK